MNEPQLGEVMNEVLHRLPLLCMVVEDGYGFSWSMEGPGRPIVSKLGLERASHRRRIEYFISHRLSEE